MISAPKVLNLSTPERTDSLTSELRPGCSKHSFMIPIFKPFIDLFKSLK